MKHQSIIALLQRTPPPPPPHPRIPILRLHPHQPLPSRAKVRDEFLSDSPSRQKLILHHLPTLPPLKMLPNMLHPLLPIRKALLTTPHHTPTPSRLLPLNNPTPLSDLIHPALKLGPLLLSRILPFRGGERQVHPAVMLREQILAVKVIVHFTAADGIRIAETGVAAPEAELQVLRTDVAFPFVL